MSLPTLSVVMPNYNHARYVEEALEAICRQSAAPKEVIVVDDASTDDSVRVVEGVARRYRFVRLLRNEANRGGTYSANRGLADCSGDYFICCSADDRVMPGLFEKSLTLLARHPEAGLCSALGRCLGPGGEDEGPYETPVISREPRYVGAAEFLPLYRRHGSWFVTHTIVFRRAPVAQLGGWDERVAVGGDGVLTFLLAARHGACFIPERLAYWRRLPQSLSSSTSVSARSILETLESQERAMASPRSGPGLPGEFLDEWRRRSLLVGLSELRERRAGCAELAALLEKLDRPGAAGRAALAAARSGLMTDLAVRCLLFANEPARGKAAIMARLLRRAAGRP